MFTNDLQHSDLGENICDWLYSVNLERLGAYNLLFNILAKRQKQPVYQQKSTHFLSNLAIRNMNLTCYMDHWVAEKHNMHWHT